ncbi:MAG: universal stress protein [Bacteroidia bacterium]|nr:universal stress protein [Bacteroidia bacterium]MCX7763491.1 universal stress protein [Bacteroidia bacterium]MDW8057395.1 universal stress protein [Bacteroidia bacterium]
MKAILHLTDFSEVARNAYAYAIEVAKKLNAELHVAHIYDKPYASIAYQGGLSAIVDAEMDTKIRSELLKHLESYVTSVSAEGIRVLLHLWGDLTVWRADEYVDKVPGTGLIVMGTRGATSIWHGGLFGTNTARLIRHSPVPVIAVHPKNVYTSYQKVLLPIDIFDEKSIHLIQKAVEFLRPWAGVKITLIVINTPYVFYDTPSIDKFLKEVKASITYEPLELRVYNDISVEEGLRQAMEAEKADLLVMGTHARKGLAQLLFGSITENVAQHLEYPLLAFPLERK